MMPQKARQGGRGRGWLWKVEEVRRSFRVEGREETTRAKRPSHLEKP